MAFSIVAAGGTLYKVTTAGVATALTLPTDTTLSTTRRARTVLMGKNIVLVNGATRSLLIDPEFDVRPLVLSPPTSAPILAAGAAGNYTGVVRAKYTYIIKNPETGALIAESAFSPISNEATITADLIAVTGIQKSPDSAVTHRRLYRTATGPGSVYFHWLDLDGNTLTAAHDDASDSAISLVAAPTDLGSAPGAAPGTFMTIIAAWKDRLWGVGDQAVDTLVYTGNRVPYGWPNSINIPQLGVDAYGITGIMPRRDELGVSKRNVFWKVVRSGSSFDLVKVREGIGCWAPDSAVVIDDIAYFLGADGVYTWGPTGINSISDEKVSGWFTTSTYFNRGQFPNAIARFNPTYHMYELLLAPTGSSSLTRWVSYDISAGKWYGPHKTDAITPSYAGTTVDSSDLVVPIIGGTNGHIYTQDASVTTDDSTVIALSLASKFHDGDTPDIEKLWLQPSFISEIQAAAGAISITAKVGGLNASTTHTLTPDMRLGREKFVRMGRGRYIQINIAGSTSASQGAEFYGYEIPYHEVGRR